jgi:phage pi2 protein 07
MDEREYSPNIEDPLIMAFFNKFAGSFDITVLGTVYYADKNGKWYHTPDTKMEFFDMISQSIKQDKNLFLNYPKAPTPEGEVED